MSSSITNKQQQILLLLYRFRFLNRTQIQTLLNHKDPKRINEWLKDLKQKEYIEKVNTTNQKENTKPTICFIGKKGISFLRSQKNCSQVIIRKLYRENERSDNFMSQCIFLADIYLDLKNQSQKNKSFVVETKSDIINPDSIFHSLIELDLQIAFLKKDVAKTEYFILQIFDLTLPVYSVKKCLKNYIDFYFQNTWEDDTGKTFPIVLIICANKFKLISTKRLTKKLLNNYQNPEDFHIRFTTLEEIKKHGITSEIWEAIN